MLAIIAIEYYIILKYLRQENENLLGSGLFTTNSLP